MFVYIDETQIPFWNLLPHYTYINSAHLDQETHFPKLDVPSSWHVGDELNVGLGFDSKCDVEMDMKQYFMKMHQSFCVVESKPTILSMRCPNSGKGCPWNMRATMFKKENKCVITKWGGRHIYTNCKNHFEEKFGRFCEFSPKVQRWIDGIS
ncbi:hypothetical protein CR513_41463, partial [Mucuna pruriens]